MTDLVINNSFKIEKIQFLSCRPYKYRGGTGVVKTIISQPFSGGLRIVFYIGPAFAAVAAIASAMPGPRHVDKVK